MSVGARSGSGTRDDGSPATQTGPATQTSARKPRRHGSRPRELRLCLLGFGSVARALCELLAAQDEVLARRHGLRVRISAVGTRRGSLVNAAGLSPAQVLAEIGGRAAPPRPPRPASALLAASAADVLVELTAMGKLRSTGAYTPAATGHILEAFRLGMDVVTANKGPIAWTWPVVSAAAAGAGRRIRFESTVMDGLPVFSLLDFALPDCALLGFEAVFNATTNTILDAMATGHGCEEALAEAQAAGIAEADPDNDLEGWDAASKAAALANVAMGAGISPADVERQRLRDLNPEWPAAARRNGRRLRLVTSVWREPSAGDDGRGASDGSALAMTRTVLEGRVRARVRAEELDIDHPLAAVNGESLGALLHTDLMADVFVSERRAFVPQAAYGVYADLLHLWHRT